LQGQPPAGEATAITESRQLMLRAEQLKLAAEIKVDEQQLNGSEILVSLSTAERDLASREVDSREALLNEWQAQASEKFNRKLPKRGQKPLKPEIRPRRRRRR